MNYINILCSLYISLIHFILAYGVLIISLVSNDIKVLTFLLIIMSLIKFAYYFFGRCILTLYEYNKYFAPVVRLFSNTLSNGINDKNAEEIVINIGLLIILNKILFLILYKYYINK